MGTRKAKRKDGFRSNFEADVSKDLKSKKIPHEYETETFKYIIEATYTPDIVLTKKDGSKIYVELKGYFDATDKRKMRAVKASNPNIDIRLVFQNANQKASKKGRTYARWAELNGFVWADKGVPLEWLKE